MMSSSDSSSDEKEARCLKEKKTKEYYDRKHEVKDVPCKFKGCDQEMVCVNGKDVYCSRMCFLKKTDIDLNGELKMNVTKSTIYGRGGTGLLAERYKLDHLQIEVRDLMGKIHRVVKIHNEGPGAAEWKLGKRTIDPKTREATEKQREADKQRLKELMNLDSDDDESDGDDDDDTDDSHQEAVQKIDPVAAGYELVCPIHPRISSGKAYVINIVNPWELHVQTLEMIVKTHEIDAVCNRPEGIDKRLVIRFWTPDVGGYCAARFEDKFYRAKILSKEKDSFRVKYVDYGNVSVVPEADVRQLSPELTLIPTQCILFKISNAKPSHGKSKWSPQSCQFAVEHLDGAEVEMEIENVELGITHVGKLKVLLSISEEVKGDFGEALVAKQLADPNVY